MSYSALTAATGLLGHFTTLDSTRKAAAELEADRWIDGTFSQWDRTLWVGPNVPPDVARCAQIIGSAEYLILDSAIVNPFAVVSPAVKARDYAAFIAKQCIDRGWVTAHDGQKLYADDQSGSGLMVDIYA